MPEVKAANLTPMMAQYQAIKKAHPDKIVMFRLGDFYEMFFDDAVTVSSVLGLVLTGREAGELGRVPMCGVPYQSANTYIARLLQRGYKIALCDQMEDPRSAKGLVRREVTRIISPGTVTDESMLTAAQPNFMAAAVHREGYGLAFLEFSTGEFRYTQWLEDDARESLLAELSRLRPVELLLTEDLAKDQDLLAAVKPYLAGEPQLLPVGGPDPAEAMENLARQFGQNAVPGVFSPGLGAAYALLSYVSNTQGKNLRHLTYLAAYTPGEFMLINADSRRHLALLPGQRDTSQSHSLFGVLDRTMTPQGARMLASFLVSPLRKPEAILDRLDAVEELWHDGVLRDDLRRQLAGTKDLERLVGRAATGVATPRDLGAMRDTLRRLPAIQALMAQADSKVLRNLAAEIDPVPALAELLTRALADDLPAESTSGGIIRDGFDRDVDELRQLAKGGKDWVAALETQERARTGIKSLKVGYNKVFGYYIEVTNPNLSQVPADYIRKQTLVGAERFVTPALKEQEEKILAAEARLTALEYDIFCRLRDACAAEASALQRTGRALATADAVAALATAALENGYTRPAIRRDGVIHIEGGRHPVVEKSLPVGEFVPNDTHLDFQDQRFLIVTGPNMGGKSTYLRQVALIVIMAQAGSFVPAAKAAITPVDRIFTRIGAQDDLAAGQSTFMVEMKELATILREATPESLILLDEVGRGTATFDGMALAWSVVEYLSQHPTGRTLFATHYHELCELEGELAGVRNYAAQVEEPDGQIIFTHRVLPGRADRSYGIQVARLAGVPPEVVARATEVLQALEDRAAKDSSYRRVRKNRRVAWQLPLFASLPSAVLAELCATDPTNMTPLEAINKLAELREKALKETASGEGVG